MKRENDLEDLLKHARSEIGGQGVDPGTVATGVGVSFGRGLAGMALRASR